MTLSNDIFTYIYSVASKYVVYILCVKALVWFEFNIIYWNKHPYQMPLNLFSPYCQCVNVPRGEFYCEQERKKNIISDTTSSSRDHDSFQMMIAMLISIGDVRRKKGGNLNLTRTIRVLFLIDAILCDDIFLTLNCFTPD